MIKEDYVSFEVAKLLKEKGFDEVCDKKYFGDDYSGPSYIRDSWEDGGNVCPMSNSDLDDGSKYADISAPTQSMAMKWLREVHNIHIVLHPYTDMQGHNWSFVLDAFAYNCWQELAMYTPNSWNTYEEAADAAIKYCLDLI